MGLAILVLITALAISSVAIYYSVAGLVAIFAAASIPIVIMGGTLEIAKLITAVWLHKYWNRTTWWLKGYLSIAIVVLMLITSMGIFGFLSKAHIEQTSASFESEAQIERLNSEITRQQNIIERSDQRIKQVESSGSGGDANLQQQIDKEQQRIDSAYNRVQQAELNIATRLEPFKTELTEINSSLQDLDNAVTNGDIRRAQGIVGASQDGQLGPKTSTNIQNFRNEKQERREQLLNQIEEIRNSNEGVSIARQQIKDGNELINRLRSQLGKGTTQDIDTIVDEQQERIKQANIELDILNEEKFTIESTYRKLEAEVGPIKYIAEFVFEDTAKATLENAVRWMIVIIIFVFDPLAVLLLIASQYTFRYWREDHPITAQVVKENIFSILPGPISNTFAIRDREESEKFQKEQRRLWRERLERTDAVTLTEEEKDRAARFEVLEQDLTMKEAKSRWKDKNPDETLKEYKNAYIRGHIDKLPWEDYVEDSTDNSTG